MTYQDGRNQDGRTLTPMQLWQQAAVKVLDASGNLLATYQTAERGQGTATNETRLLGQTASNPREQ